MMKLNDLEKYFIPTGGNGKLSIPSLADKKGIKKLKHPSTKYMDQQIREGLV